jgi:hypothetical protein
MPAAEIVMTEKLRTELGGMARIAEANVISFDVMTAHLDAAIKENNGEHPPITRPEMHTQKIISDEGYNIVFSMEEWPSGTMRHLSISAPILGDQITKETVFPVMSALGYREPLEIGLAYSEKVGDISAILHIIEQM